MVERKKESGKDGIRTRQGFGELKKTTTGVFHIPKI